MAANPSAAQFARRHAKARVLTPEQVREMRLSLDPDIAWIERLGVNKDTIRKARLGIAYGDLREDEASAMRQRRNLGRAKNVTLNGEQANVLEQLIVAPAFPVVGRPDLAERFDHVEALDAADECSHGRLPHDHTPSCGCWPQEITKTNPTQEDHHGSNHFARLGRFEAQVRDIPALPGRDPEHQPAHA